MLSFFITASLALGLTSVALLDSAQAAQTKRKNLATVTVRQPTAVNPSATSVVLKGTIGGKYRGRALVQRHHGNGWRTVARLRATATFKKKVRLARSAMTFRVVVSTARGPVSSNRVTVKRAKAKAPSAYPSVDAFDAQRLVVLNATNELRAANGLRPLKPMPALDQIATKWTRKMAATQVMVHNPAFWVNYPAGYRAGAENIGYGYSPAGMTAAWKNSPMHRRNLLGNYTHIGIGVAQDKNGLLWYTQDFALY